MMISSEVLLQYYRYWMNNDILCWGVGAVLSAQIGFWVTALAMEWLCNQPWTAKWTITYNRTARADRLGKTQERIPFQTQVAKVVWESFGPNFLLNGVASYFLLSLIDTPRLELPSVSSAITSFTLLHFIGDFFLYWGHRIQHEIPLLWKLHSFHHQVDTPSPISTIYIDSIDATLQGGLPLLFSALIIQPHPLIMYWYIITRVAENCLNHSGLEYPLLNWLYFKVVPGRATVSHHDSHHMFSGKGNGRNAKNYAEFFWIWDYVFGTYRNPLKTRDPIPQVMVEVGGTVNKKDKKRK